MHDIDTLEGEIPRRFKDKPSMAFLNFYHYGAEIPIEEIRFPMAIPNGHLEWFYYHIW